ncbi:hypothetical protein AB1Y20_021625 [Prymnesium parvum]|uniref:Uncharacterized protein n=1 Tax=Prymnesium parvum TaxID=97485 RepID=A0AB34JM27_PRYPA
MASRCAPRLYLGAWSCEKTQFFRSSLRAQCLKVKKQLGAAGSSHDTTLAHELRDSVEKLKHLFDEAEGGGYAVRDRTTASTYLFVLCTPHAPWQHRELARALQLFTDNQQQRESAVPTHTPQAHPEPQASFSSGIREGAGTPFALDEIEIETASGPHVGASYGEEGDDSIVVGGVCDVVGCGAVARYGSATTGYVRACKEHRVDGEERVDLHEEALFALANSCSTSSPVRLTAAAQIFHYALTAAQKAFYPRGVKAHLGAKPAGKLTHFFTVCAKEKRMPSQAKQLLPLLLSLKATSAEAKREAVNTYMYACVRAGDSSGAWAAHVEAERAGLSADFMTLNTLAMASSSNAYLLETVQTMAERFPGALREPHIVTPLLHSHAKLRQHVQAEALYSRALAQGLFPTPHVLGARCFAFAMSGQLDSAIVAFEEARDLLQQIRASNEEASLDALASAGAARRVLDASEHMLVSVVLSAFVEAEQPAQAFTLFNKLCSNGFVPRRSDAIVPLLHAASHMEGGERALSIYHAAVESGIEPDARMLYAAVAAMTGHHVRYGTLSPEARRKVWAELIKREATSRDPSDDLPRGDESEAKVHHLQIDEAFGLCWQLHEQGHRLVNHATITALLCGANKSGQARHADEAVRLAHAHGVKFDCMQRNLLLAARLASIPTSPRTAEAQLRKALALYFHGRERGWTWRGRTIQWLARTCVDKEYLDAAAELMTEYHRLGLTSGLDSIPTIPYSSARSLAKAS